MCAEHYDNFIFHRLYSAAEGLLHRRPERDLLRRAEGPAVHLGSQVAGSPLGADGSVATGRGTGATAGAGDELYLRRSLEFPAETAGRRESVHLALFPKPQELTGDFPADFDRQGCRRIGTRCFKFAMKR